MTFFLLLTAFTVSIDSFVCGFSLSFESRKRLPVVVIIATTVFIMCVTVNYAAHVFDGLLSEKTANLGGIGLVAIGLYNLFKKEKTDTPKGSIVRQSFVTGFSVGLDGAFANLSLALIGINAFYVPLTIALMHAILIYLGMTLSKIKCVGKIEKFSFIPPLILIALGLYKIICAFI
ncbi:MAG: manganese efflux pump [Clostridia bacterium]|nr:manganese efflux pump [Clostridia bacterium]